MTKTIAEFVSDLKSLDIQLSVEGQNAALDKIRLRCSAPAGTLTAELRQELADRKAELISYLQSQSTQSVQLAVQETVFPLSFAQQRLWFLYQLAPDNPFYNVPAAIRLTGNLNQTALERAFSAIVQRHAALRTTFTIRDEQPVQIVLPHLEIKLAIINLQTVPVNERESIRQQLATAEAQHPFNLTTDPLLRVTLLQFDSTEAVLLLTLHHIVADGWSLGILIRELGYFYTAFVEARVPEMPPLPIQYPDFACWQRQWLQGEILEKQLAYWRQQLRDLPGLQLPSDRPRPAVPSYRGATYPIQISPLLTQKLVTLSQQSKASLFMTLIAAFQTLLYRYTEQKDIAIGTPIANRHHSQVEELIGFFVNSLVIRAHSNSNAKLKGADIASNPSFCNFLEYIRHISLEAYAHQDLPFEKLVEELEPERDLSRNPLFQVAFALQNAPMPSLELPELSLEPAPLQSSSTRFDLEVHLWESTHGLRSFWQSQAGLSGFIAYSTDLFDADRIGRLVGHFQTLLEGIVADPDTRLSDLPLLTASEQQTLNAWSQSRPFEEASNPKASNHELYFHRIFESHVRETPAAVAVVSEQGSLTYAELNQRADHLAQLLKQMGVQANSLVGLCVERSAEMVIGILAILKAEAAYVPLDPTYPSERLQFMLADTQVAVLLTQSWFVAALPLSSTTVFCLDQPWQISESSSLTCLKSNQLEPAPLDPLAYVIYTSGSTGTPKGVLLSHRGLCNVVEAQRQVFHPSSSSRVLQFSSLSFDASVFEIALAFGSGGTLYIPPQAARLPGMALVRFLESNAITHALLTPAVLAVLPSAELLALQVLITGGEACSSQVVDRWAANRRFFNAYGPTETTIWATVVELHPGDNPLMIGRPILNTQVYILDTHLNPVPVGIPGELYIGGTGLALGYLHRSELTAERFIHIERLGNVRLYKSGDRVLFHSDGTIEFLGRVDQQIKIRGFRVELGEIEATLRRHPAIQDAVVTATKETSSEMRLLAYFCLNNQHFQQHRQLLQTQQIQHWQTLYDQTYNPIVSSQKFKLVDSSANSAATALGIQVERFNTIGWNSSYSGEPIPVEQMQEWVSDRVRQILALKPQRVLEIGCGTGLLLFQIAPHCQTYVATDFSATALETIQAQLADANLPQVKLLHRVATDLQGVEPAFDVIILNSIVQYFPSADYLMQVLENAMQTLAPAGVLFVGDVRSLPLLTAFHTWVHFYQADASTERTQLQQQVERSQFEEPELAIDPAFFHALRDRFPQIQQVQIRLSRGYAHNEMTQFRYNVLLSVNTSSQSSLQSLQPVQHYKIQKHNWKRSPITVANVEKILIETQPEILIVTNISNSRVNSAIKVVNWLRNQETPKTVGRMRELLENVETANHENLLSGIDPQVFWDLETTLPYSVEITWSAQTNTGDYDLLLIHQGINVDVDAIIRETVSDNNLDDGDIDESNIDDSNLDDGDIDDSNVSESDIDESDTVDRFTQKTDHHYPAGHCYTNEPLQPQFARQLIPQLRQYLSQTLPDYMLPAVFVPLESLPLTTSGKVNRLALPSHHDLYSSKSTQPTIAASTSTELTLIEIWKELLRLKQVNIHDNFFELGGHSLLATQMISRVRDALGLELPLQSVFTAPTIAQLAPILETLSQTASPSVPPLVRLDRTAYRRKPAAFEPATVKQVTVKQVTAANNPKILPDQQVPVSLDSEEYQPEEHEPRDNSAEFAALRSPLVPLTLSDSKQPFFCIHPMFGVVFPYLELAHHLGISRSFYGLQPLGLNGKQPPLTTIQAMAAYYIRAIQTLQPQGPYFLGGWSFGGLVAFEMAQQLTQAKQEIALLAILDTPAPTQRQRSLPQNLKFLLGTALWSTLPFLLDYGALVTNRICNWQQLIRWQWSEIGRQLPEEAQLQLLDESAIAPLLRIVYANSRAVYQYIPQYYHQRVTLFHAVEPGSSSSNSTLGWSELADDVQLHQVPGNHLSLLKQPHVQILAQQLRQYLL